MQPQAHRLYRQAAAASGAVMAVLLSASAAHAMVKIGSAATVNMSCANGVCAPTAKDAVLNVGDLENLLSSGNVTVTTTGDGIEAEDAHVNAALAWSSPSTLSLDAHRSIQINAEVSVAGLGGLTIDTGRNSALSFGKRGNVTFTNLSSSLVISGASYTLVGDIKTLAGDIAANPNGDFALANSYDASGDGTYREDPVGTAFSGTFEGLGNAISNLSIDGGTKVQDGTFEAFFVETAAKATVRDFGLIDANIDVASRIGAGATLVGGNRGAVISCYATGRVSGGGSYSANGGLVGISLGTIINSHSSVAVKARAASAGGLVAFDTGRVSESSATGPVSSPEAGGLVGDEFGTVTNSLATGRVTARMWKGVIPIGGGLVGAFNNGEGEVAEAISNSYATGRVSGPDGSNVGGLVGRSASTNSTISASYSTGAVTGGVGSEVGGLIGQDNAELNTDTYWDTDTSGITNLSQGAGTPPNDPGIAGLTTSQLQSGLPAGFDPAVWAENPNINGGLPYLRSNPPPT